MKSFFFIRGETTKHQWFDQLGKEIPLFGDTDIPDVRNITPFPHDAVGSDFKIYDPREVKQFHIHYHVIECESKEEVEYLAKQQNEVYELD